MSKSQLLNYLAIDVLESMDIAYPTQAEIEMIESLLKRLLRKRGVTMKI